MTIPTAILGPTGYTGLELLEILLRHPTLRPAFLGSARAELPKIDEEFPRLAGRLSAIGAPTACEPINHDVIAQRCKLAFLCLPHEAAMTHTPALLSRGVKVVDLSAAYRLRDTAVYQQHYGHAHHDATNLEHAVYGLTEFARDQVRSATLVANPGCYPTAAAIALIPLLRAGLIDPASIIISAASGVSGAGREAKPNLHFPEANENFSVYGIGTHRHQPEIQQSLSKWGTRPRSSGGGGGSFGASTTEGAEGVLFVAHLLPVIRGILETIYATPIKPGLTTAEVQAALRAAYENQRFIAVRDAAPTLRDVQHTNMVHVNARVVNKRVVLVAAIDNLIKGASGQAVQNANLMLGLDESAGLS